MAAAARSWLLLLAALVLGARALIVGGRMIGATTRSAYVIARAPAARPRGRGCGGHRRGRGDLLQTPPATEGRGSSEAEARRRALRGVCAAIRSAEWDNVGTGLAAERWSRGEWRAMVQAAAQVSDWQGACRLLDEMRARGLPVDGPAFGHTLVACARAGELDVPIRLLDELAEAGIAPELRPMNQLI
eukprot:scaffold306095_cov33-Tisochrysis_lutea.AAC.1